MKTEVKWHPQGHIESDRDLRFKFGLSGSKDTISKSHCVAYYVLYVDVLSFLE